MGLPAGYPAADASFDGVEFWELSPGGRYVEVPLEEEHVIVGTTVITRYGKLRQVTVPGLASIADAETLDGKRGVSGDLVWHRGTDTAVVIAVAAKHIPELGVAEVSLTVLI